MVERDGTAAGVDQRFTQPAGAMSVADGDVSTSPEALAVLVEQGHDAWRAWVKQHSDQARRFNPRQPRDSEGKFADTGASFFSGHGGVQRLPSAGEKLGTGEKATVRPIVDRNPAPAGARPVVPPRVAAAVAAAKRQGLARKPKTFPEVNRIADRLGVPAPHPASSRGWTGDQWGAYWATVLAGGDMDDGVKVADQYVRSVTRVEGALVRSDVDDPDEDPVIVWFDESHVLGDDEPVAVDNDWTMAGPEQARAADVSGSNLKQYWTVGAGLAKWRASPTPWRTLRRFLSKYLSGHKLDATTSSWYRIVFGKLPGQ